MLGVQSGQHRPPGFGQRLPGGDAAGPQRVAAAGRQLLRRQDGAHRRRGQKRDVGVPVVVVGRVVVVGVEHDDLGHARRLRVDRVDVQVAEARGQCALRKGRNRLAFGLALEEQHLVLEQRRQ